MRQSGILLHITSLPSREKVGTLGESAYRFVDFLVSAGVKVWQVLPVGPTGYAESPYQSTSTYAGNPLMIDLETLYNEGLTDELPKKARHRGLIDFETARAEKDAALRHAFAYSYDKVKEALSYFAMMEPWTKDYTLFMAVKKQFGYVKWMDWPDSAIRLREKEAVAAYEKELAEEIAYQLFLQYLFRKQWLKLKSYANAHGVKLFGDMPIYVAEDSSDTWAHPECFLLDKDRRPKKVAGVPPDYFSADGQLWGNPIYDWAYMRRTGYAWWLERFAAMGKLFDMVRVDHFIGFANYYSIPAGAKNARNGKWVNNDGKALFRAVKKNLPGLSIIAENLGVLSQRVQDLLDWCGYPGMQVLQFSFGDGAVSPEAYPANALCYTGTHDNNTTLAWWESAGETEKANVLRLLGEEAEDNIDDVMIRAAYESGCDTAIVPMQDWLHLGGEARMNTPGTVGGSNWCWRMTPGSCDKKLADTIRTLGQETER